MKKNLIETALNFIFPQACGFCGEITNSYLCEYCNEYLKQNELDKFLGEVANQCTKMSLEADKAEREAKKMRMAEYMEHHIGEEFDGIITYIGSRYINVRTSCGIIGVINYSNLYDDNYVYYFEENKIVGKNTGNSYTLGSPITFTVMDASKKNRAINFMTGKKKDLKGGKVYKRKRNHTS